MLGMHVGRRLVALVSTAGLAAGALVAGAAPAAAATSTVTLRAVADTWVDSARPSTAYGASTALTADASPAGITHLRFDLSSLAGRSVSGVWLRLHQVDSSRTGGRVTRSSSTTWPESTTTWGNRPPVGSTALATFGAVSAGSWYEVALDPAALGTGLVSLAIDSPSSDGARWASRESANPPALLVTVTDPDPALAPADSDGLTAVAAADAGSSEPTYYSGNHRLAVTAAGRSLAIYGRHSSGIQLTWRDPGAAWQTASTGDSSTGAVLAGTGTGDWPASLAVARAADGVEHGWVVWAGRSAGTVRTLQMRHLTGLDAPGGPRLGPLVTLAAPAGGAYRADVAVERAPDGGLRVAVVHTRRVDDTTYELVTGWLSDPASDAPSLVSPAVLERTTSSSSHFASLVSTPAGLRAVARAGASKLYVYVHDRAAGLDQWTLGSTGAGVPSTAAPNGASLPSGEMVVTFEDDVTNRVSSAFLVSAAGTTITPLLRQAGLAQPTVMTSGSDAVLVAVRPADGALVSRTWSGGAWSSQDRVEVAASATGGSLGWPNAARDAAGKLRVLLEGTGTSDSRSSVWAHQRTL